MQKFTVGFSKSKKKFAIGSWLIRLYQWTKFSHTYIRRKSDIYTSDIMMHASEGLVQHMSGVQFDKKHEVVAEFDIEISDEKWKQLRALMHYYSGDNYSIMQNVGIMLVDFMRLFDVRIKNPWHKGWNCSEFVMTVLQQIYPAEFSSYDPNTVTPKEVYRILLELESQGRVSRR